MTGCVWGPPPAAPRHHGRRRRDVHLPGARAAESAPSTREPGDISSHRTIRRNTDTTTTQTQTQTDLQHLYFSKVLVQVLQFVRVPQCAPRGWHACPKSGGRGDHINEPIGGGERKGRRGTLPNPPLRLAAPPTTATNRRRVDHRFHLTPLGAHPTTHFGEMPRVRWTLSDACPTVSVTYRLQRRRCCCGGAGEPRGAAVAEHPQPQAAAARGRRDGRRANR